jgi:transcriptional regulator with XRE-family HTH domain
MTKGRGDGKTPTEVVRRLKLAVSAKSQSAVSRETGIPLFNIQRYLKGIGEPTTATLQKLADYFGVNIRELRNDQGCILDFSGGYQVSVPYNTLMLNAVEMALLFDVSTTQTEFNSVLTAIITRYSRDLPGEPFTLDKEQVLSFFENYKRDQVQGL